jgi:L-iditol 2-dehydrogenase
MHFAGILYGIDNIKYKSLELDEVNSNEVIVSVKCAGICGSDIPRIKTKGTYNFPTVPGHEFSGIISFIGKEVKNVSIGDRVTIYPLISCEKCSYCRSGKENLCENYNYLGSRCDGGFAEYVKCPARNVLKIPSSVNFEEAALVEPMAVALRGVNRAKVESGSKVLVLGLGPIGMFASQWAKIKGAKTVVGVDRNYHKLEIAKIFGIKTININEEFLDKNFDVVIECSGSNTLLEIAINKVKKSGIISILGNPKKEVIIKEKIFQKILRNEIQLNGNWNSLITPDKSEWDEVLYYLGEHKLSVNPIITHKFNLENIKEVFDVLFDKKYDNYCKGMFIIGGN